MTTSRYPNPGFQFGPFFLDTKGRRLVRDGERVKITPMALKLLETLLVNRGKVLTGKELRILVWSENPTQASEPFQDKNALYVTVRKLKKSLGEDFATLIVNIPKGGYTLSDDVEVIEISESVTDLPQSTTNFVGREEETSFVIDLINKNRLFTLAGSFGIGKTRLAIRAAELLKAEFFDGVYLVDLVTIPNNDLVPKAVASTLNVIEEPGQNVTDSLRRFIKTKHLLLVLDNCEHVIEGVRDLVEGLLRASTNLKILATSRQPLDVAGESIYRVQPLLLPPEDWLPNEAEVTDYSGLRLFLELAGQRNPNFKVTPQNVSTIAELCRELEGIPLAIELAASRTDSIPAEQILSLMTDRFRLLRRDNSEDSRDKTLEGSIDWSYELLSKEEQTLFRRLTVFSGGWTIEAAASICTDSRSNENDAVYWLSGLIKKSFVSRSEKNGRERYRMLESIRQYGRKKLKDTEEKRLMGKHAEYFVELSERAFEQGEKDDWMERLEDEHPNLRQALRHTVRKGGSIELGLRLCGALARFWFIRGHIGEAIEWTKRILALDKGNYQDARARTLRTAGFFFGHMPTTDQDSELGREYFEESISIWQDLGNEKELARTLTNYSFLQSRQGNLSSAVKTVKRALSIFKKLGDEANIARASVNLAVALLEQGKPAEAIPLFEESLRGSLNPDVADKHLQALCLHNLGDAEMQTGNLVRAEQRLDECLTISKELGHRTLLARTAIIQGEILVRQGRHKKALKNQRNALRELQSINDKQGIIDAVEAIACTNSMTGNAQAAFILFTAAQKLRAAAKILLGPARKRLLEECLSAAAKSLEPVQTKHLLSKAQNYDLERIIEYALDDV